MNDETLRWSAAESSVQHAVRSAQKQGAAGVREVQRGVRGSRRCVSRRQLRMCHLGVTGAFTAICTEKVTFGTVSLPLVPHRPKIGAMMQSKDLVSFHKDVAVLVLVVLGSLLVPSSSSCTTS